MTKIEQIEKAIERALRRESRLTPLALSVPALSSLNIRHLMNNLGSISDTYLECGVHKGGLFSSTITNNPNLRYATAIDSWESDTHSDDKAETQFDESATILASPETRIIKIKAKCFEHHIDDIPGNYDFFLYDAGHSYEDQKNALLFYDVRLKNEFIFCVDDYDWEEVKQGTADGIREGGYDILFEKSFKGNDHDNEGWWNGYAIFLLKKKS
jgi:hypothetical protein